MDDNTLQFFLGANTPQGFVSRFDQLADVEDGWRSLVIKGGPGSGKSTMMKKIAAEAGADDGFIELIHCSSDVDSLDGVIVPKRKFSIADGTPPHPVEPRYPGAFEQLVDLTGCWDSDVLYQNREEIIRLFKSCSQCHEYCCRFLSAAGSLTSDTYRIALNCVNTQKLSGYCSRLSAKEFRPIKGRTGKESVRFLSAVTNKGVVVFTETAKKLCDRVYLVADDHGAVSRLLLTTIRSKALEAGYDVISCYCPLSPFEKLEQLFIPSLKLGFMTSNRYHDFTMDITPYRIIHYQRFTDNDCFKASKKRVSFNRKAGAQMIEQAVILLKDSKKLHDELEEYYIRAMDFAGANALTEKVLAKIQTFSRENDQ